MKHLKLFASHSQFIEPTDKPAVSYCEQENEVHYSPIPMINGHEYIDLGLPSGTLWAKCNVGANSETDYGLYFAWGETAGYTASQVGTDKQFSWSDYKFGGTSSNPTKYNSTDGKTVLDLEDDAAHVNMGGDWHMPNRAQCIELFQETKNGFVTNAGVFTQYAWDNTNSYLNPTETTVTISNWDTTGYFFFNSNVSDINAAITSGDYLFIPAAGNCNYGEIYSANSGGYVYTSDLNSENIESALDFYFLSRKVEFFGNGRCQGFSVRGVVGQMNVSAVEEPMK